jgi:predicted transcriptional regulator
MTTIELKKSIIQRIAEIEDSEFLKAIKTIIDSNQAETVFKVTEPMKKDIETGQQQIREGNYTTHDELEKEIIAWLKEKK